MSTMTTGKTLSRVDVRQKIAELEQELDAWKTLEAQLALIDANVYAGLKGLFKDLPPYEAICAFLKREGSPRSRDAIIQAVIAGGAVIGKHQDKAITSKSVNQSISTNVGLKKLKEKNDLVGLVEWEDSRFS